MLFIKKNLNNIVSYRQLKVIYIKSIDVLRQSRCRRERIGQSWTSMAVFGSFTMTPVRGLHLMQSTPGAASMGWTGLEVSILFDRFHHHTSFHLLSTKSRNHSPGEKHPQPSSHVQP